MKNWIEFKDGQNPRTNEIIAVKGPSGIFTHLILVKEGPLKFVRFDDQSIIIQFHGLTHWKLINSPY